MRALGPRIIVIALLLAFTGPAFAVDPVVMFLLSVAREMVFKAVAREQAAAAAEQAPAAVATYPGTMVQPEDLKRLIDESFTYLSQAQRQEIFDSLHAALMDPKNAAVRASMIEYFAQRAFAIREAQDRLTKLSPQEKSLLAADFRKQVAALPEEEAVQIAELLRRNLLPVPSDLNEMLLAALVDR